jgi:predicted transport protein
MPLYHINDQLNLIRENSFKLEKDLQTLTENNLEKIFGLQLVKSEFALQKFRIDTLAYDKESNAFVIIEYKRSKNFSVIDQGYAYLSLMLNNKSDFILEFNENLNNTLKRNDVDWSQSRVLFVSQNFTNYQREAINFKDLPIELWEITRYENQTVSYEQIIKSDSQESINTISKSDKTIRSVAKEIKVYTEQEHFQNVSDEIKELYDKVKSAILDLGNIEIKPKKKYIAFVCGKNIVDIHPQQKALKMWLNMSIGELDDPKQLTRDVSTTGHWGNGDYEIRISSDENLEYLLSLIKQSINKNKNL